MYMYVKYVSNEPIDLALHNLVYTGVNGQVQMYMNVS